jgi:hypothetical protein
MKLSYAALSLSLSLSLVSALGCAATGVDARLRTPSAASPAPFAARVTGHGPPMILIPGLASAGDVWSGTVVVVKVGWVGPVNRGQFNATLATARRRVSAALEAVGVMLAETALAPRAEGDLERTVRVWVRATVGSAGDAAHLLAPKIPSAIMESATRGEGGELRSLHVASPGLARRTSRPSSSDRPG